MRHILKPFTIIYIIYLRHKYRRLTNKWRFEQSNQHLAILRLLQAKIHYYYSQMDCWGYYHPSCIYNDKHIAFMKWLFPPRDFMELELVAWYNPGAITYYRNEIFRLTKGKSLDNLAIEKQLHKWDKAY